MSDLTPDQLDALKSRDSRFAVLAEAIAVEADLRDNPTIKLLMAAVRQDADAAMEELADLSAADPVAMHKALVNVKTLVYIRRTLNALLQRGQVAELEIRQEDERHAE